VAPSLDASGTPQVPAAQNLDLLAGKKFHVGGGAGYLVGPGNPGYYVIYNKQHVSTADAVGIVIGQNSFTCVNAYDCPAYFAQPGMLPAAIQGGTRVVTNLTFHQYPVGSMMDTTNFFVLRRGTSPEMAQTLQNLVAQVPAPRMFGPGQLPLDLKDFQAQLAANLKLPGKGLFSLGPLASTSTQPLPIGIYQVAGATPTFYYANGAGHVCTIQNTSSFLTAAMEPANLTPSATQISALPAGLTNDGNCSVPQGLAGSYNGFIFSSANTLAISGFACQLGSASSISVDVYIGGPMGVGTSLGKFPANLTSGANEQTVCQAAGAQYSFQVPMTVAQQTQFAGQNVFVYAVPPGGGPEYQLPQSTLGTSNLLVYTVPYTNGGQTVGSYNGCGQSASGSPAMTGWACAVGNPASIEVEIYAEGPIGIGRRLGTYLANTPSGPPGSGPTAACLASGTQYGFQVPFTAKDLKLYANKSIYVYAVPPTAPKNSPVAPNLLGVSVGCQ
jgi:hypothetical protein